MPTAYEPKRDRPPDRPTGQPPQRTVDTAGAVSQQNIESLKRGFAAVGRLDGESMLEECDPEIEFRPKFQGKALRVTEYLDRNEALEAAGLTE